MVRLETMTDWGLNTARAGQRQDKYVRNKKEGTKEDGDKCRQTDEEGGEDCKTMGKMSDSPREKKLRLKRRDNTNRKTRENMRNTKRPRGREKKSHRKMQKSG